ncbi:unnamed protein product, partial [Timema podura]|nr:unnamed protein product [Timema podura]
AARNWENVVVVTTSRVSPYQPMTISLTKVATSESPASSTGRRVVWRGVLNINMFLENVIQDAVTYTEHA